MTNKTKNTIKAFMYIIVGATMMFGATFFIIFMFLSGTFLPYRYVLRKVLYFLSFCVILIGLKMFEYGREYLGKRYEIWWL